MDVGQWLAGLGLEVYAGAFAEHQVDGETLPLLSMEDLREIGVVAVGHRRRLMAAIEALRQPQAPARPAAPPAVPDAGTRREVTVLFADIVGYTSLGSELDAETLHTLLSAYFDEVDTVISRLGGTIDKHIGDSAMAVFGAPVAHADHVLRAVRAAEAIHAAMPAISTRCGRAMQVHIGVASGDVVASATGSALHREYTVTGDTVNLAARLTSLAGPGETVVSEDVVRTLEDLLEAEPLGPQAVKGLARPVATWRMVRLREPGAQDEKPIIGRRSELAQCTAALQATIDGSAGGRLYLRGEAGIGKSRLMREVMADARRLGFACHGAAIYDFGAGLDRDPLRSIARSLVQAETVRAGSGGDRLALKDLLGLPLDREEHARLDAMNAGARAVARSEALIELAVAAARAQPLLIAIEDLHWADPATLRGLAALARTGPERAPIALAMTSRPENDPLASPQQPFAGLSLTVIELGPLREQDARALAQNLLDRSDPLLDQCIARAGGHPLFLEQLLRNARAGGLEEAVPGSIRSVVLAQVDRLQPADRAALQAAAVLGDQFTAAAVAHLLGQPSVSVERLATSRLVRPDGETLHFAHALIREGVYASLLQSERRRLHMSAAAWFGGKDPALRAEHLAKAGDPGAPAAFLEAARELAAGYRLEEALDCVGRGASVAGSDVDRAALALEEGALQLELGQADRALAAYERAETLASDNLVVAVAKLGKASVLRLVDRLREALQLLAEAEPLLAAAGSHAELARLEHLRGNLCFPLGHRAGCREAHQRALEHARRCSSPELMARALGGLGDAAYAEGLFLSATDYFGKCIALAREHGLGRVEVANLPMLAAARAFYDEPAAVLDDIAAAIAAARAARQPRAELVANHIAMFSYLWLGQPEAVAPLFERAQEIVAQIGARRFEPENISLMAEAHRQLGERQRAVDLSAQAVDMCRSMGMMPYYGASVLGLRAIAVFDQEELRMAALREAESHVGASGVAHNALLFGIFAIEASLMAGAWADAEAYADMTEAAFTREPLPYVEFVVERGRLLARHQAGVPFDEEMRHRLQACIAVAEAKRYGFFLPALRPALAASDAAA